MPGDVLSAVVGAGVAGAAGATRWLVTRRLPARRIWRFDEGTDAVVVVATLVKADTNQNRLATGLGQVRGVSLIAPSLMRAYRSANVENIRLSALVGGSDLERNLVVLGGTKNNAVTERILSGLGGQLPFTLTRSGEVINWQGDIRESDFQNGKVVRDYGVIVRSVNPMAPGKRIVLLAGLRTYGTVAAARWLLSQGGARQLPADVAVLVEADVLPDQHVGVPRMIHQSRL
ncbi:hypothetical protein [Streptacidiphilus sp. P02-A3a]|uniref:hypothetical protein n=1 Tax=Streptacidiphilus sp. P02-A3a TaxID=2704468 RepID=UPI0015F97E48|nr:hypothetical protein [Streptacidiphilus sp. P02-A3a]QMU69079.1 hypothetical protein GXP74_13330 [Streptacidiphilus sp. P02-A3a]